MTDVVDAVFGWCRTLPSDLRRRRRQGCCVAVATETAVRPDVKSRQADRGPLLSTCREPAAGTALRYA